LNEVNRRPLLLILLVAAALVTVLAATATLAADADAKRRTKRYCTPRSYPIGCIWVPREARRNRKIDPQDKPAVAPPNVVSGGGEGGGDGVRELGALDWANGFTGSDAWAYRSERFVEAAYAVHGKFATPRVARRHLRLTLGSPQHAPKGTLMLFAADSANAGVGHVGLSLGGGRMLSALDVVRDTNVAGSRYWRNIYLGWSRAPRGWAGRIPLPFDLTEPAGTETATILSPAYDAPISGIVRLQASTTAGNGLAFAAFYSDDPAGAAAPSWHHIGRATASGETQILDWDTAAVPPQGSPALGTVTIAAIVVDPGGNLLGVGDYRRVTVRPPA
jgi:hypothetical protein